MSIPDTSSFVTMFMFSVTFLSTPFPFLRILYAPSKWSAPDIVVNSSFSISPPLSKAPIASSSIVSNAVALLVASFASPAFPIIPLSPFNVAIVTPC